MKNDGMIACAPCVVALFVGCQSTPKEPEVSVDDSIQALACELTAKAVESNRLGGSKRPVLAFGRIQNDTMSVRPGSFELVKSRIAEVFSASGLVLVLSDEEEKNQMTSQLSPTHIMNGRLVQRETASKNGGKHVMYTLQLSILDATSGVRVWDGQRTVGFVIDKDKPTW